MLSEIPGFIWTPGNNIELFEAQSELLNGKAASKDLSKIHININPIISDDFLIRILVFLQFLLPLNHTVQQ